MKTLHQCLLDYPLVLLQAIAEMRGVRLASTGQQQVADQLAAALTDPPNIAAAVAACSPEAQAALRELIAASGRVTAPAFARAHGELRTFGPGRLARETPWRNPINAAEELWYRSLIARGFAPLGAGLAEFVFVPRDVLPHLPLAAAEPPGFHLAPAPQPAVVQIAADSLLEDACTLLSFVQEEGAWVDHRSRWRARSLAALNERLMFPARLDSFDPEESGDPLALLLHLAKRLGWLREEQRQLHLQAAPVRTWLEGTHPQQRQLLWAAWRDAPEWDDLCRSPGLRCESTGPHDRRVARHKLLGHLARCEAGVWYAVSDFAAAVKRVDPDFQRPDGDYRSWYVRDAASGRYLMGFEHWEQVEGTLIAYVLSGPAHWLGATDVGEFPPHAADGAAAPPAAATFRLTAAGAALLGLAAEEPPQPTPPRLTVQPDFRVLVPHGTACFDRFRLGRFAVWEASRPAFRYRITQAALKHAQEQGISTAPILAFLRRASGGDLPPNIVRALTTWEK